MRVDIYLSQKYAISRHRVQDMIRSGLVQYNGKILKKASIHVHSHDVVEIIEHPRWHWVSRSAQKLADFLVCYSQIPVEGRHAIDIGASTWGFTQVLLQHGVASVDAVEVGTGQMHSSLRQVSNVHVYEQTDIRNFAIKTKRQYDIIVSDVSFISLQEIFPAIQTLSNTTTDIIVLLKPQFQVKKSLLTKHGVPKHPGIIEQVRQEFASFLHSERMTIRAEMPSTLRWEAGNQEYIYWIQKW